MSEDFSLKEIFIQALNICTRVITLVFVISTIIVFLTNGTDVSYSLKDIWCVILIGFISGAGYTIFYLPKKVGKILMFLLQTLYFLVINATVLIVGFYQNWFNANEKASVILMEVMFVVIYVFVSIMTYVFDYRKASKLNQMLNKRKDRSGE